MQPAYGDSEFFTSFYRLLNDFSKRLLDNLRSAVRGIGERKENGK
jgi:hypothetical protein